MKKLSIFISIISIIFCLTLYAAEERIVNFRILPAAVQETVLEYVNRNDITKVELIKDEGVTKYEIESVTNGKTLDITVAENGILLEIEKGISFSELPLEAQREINKDYPTIKTSEIESVNLFYYDVEGQVDGKTVKFKVLPSGDIEDLAPDKDDGK